MNIALVALLSIGLADSPLPPVPAPEVAPIIRTTPVAEEAVQSEPYSLESTELPGEAKGMSAQAGIAPAEWKELAFALGKPSDPAPVAPVTPVLKMPASVLVAPVVPGPVPLSQFQMPGTKP